MTIQKNQFLNLGITALSIAMSYISESNIPLIVGGSCMMGSFFKEDKNAAFHTMIMTGMMSLIGESYIPLLVGASFYVGNISQNIKDFKKSNSDKSGEANSSFKIS